MNALRILVVSQKGGVGKSTLSANLSVWFSEKAFKNTVLLDLDPHGSSSSWVHSARHSSVFAEHAVLGDFESRRWLIDCRSRIRKYGAKSEVLVCDLTWTAAMDAELLHEFDLVVVPTSVSSIELSATIKFIESVGWVFTAKTGIPPTLLICPSRVSNDELKSDPFSKRRFSVPFMLLPPIHYDESVRQLFKKKFVFDVDSEASKSYSRCAEAVYNAGTIHQQAAASVVVKFSDRRVLATHNTKLSRYMAEKTNTGGLSNNYSQPNLRRSSMTSSSKKEGQRSSNLRGLSRILESVISSK